MAAVLGGTATSKLINSIVDQSFAKAQWIIEQIRYTNANDELRAGIIKQAQFLGELLQRLPRDDAAQYASECRLYLSDLRDHLQNCEDLIKNSGAIIELIQARDENTRLLKVEEELNKAVSRAELSVNTAIYGMIIQESKKARRNSSNPEDGLFIGIQATTPDKVHVQNVKAVADGELLRVSWIDIQNELDNITGYELEYDQTHELTVRVYKSHSRVLQQAARRWQVTLGKPKVLPGKVYSIRVRAFNGRGPGEWSEPRVCALPQPPPTPSNPALTQESVHLEAEGADSNLLTAVIMLARPKDAERVTSFIVEMNPPPRPCRQGSVHMPTITEERRTSLNHSFEVLGEGHSEHADSQTEVDVVQTDHQPVPPLAEVGLQASPAQPKRKARQYKRQTSKHKAKGLRKYNRQKSNCKMQLKRKYSHKVLRRHSQDRCRWTDEEIPIPDHNTPNSKIQLEGNNYHITLSGFRRSVQYSFRIATRNQDGIASAPSTIVTLPAGELLPGPPTNVDITDYSHNTVSLAWNVTTVNVWAVERYEVQTRTVHGTWEVSAEPNGRAQECTISNLRSNTEYYFRICSVTVSGYRSPCSRAVHLRKTTYHPFRQGMQTASITLGTTIAAPLAVPVIHVVLGLDKIDQHYKSDRHNGKAYAAFFAAATVLTAPISFILSPILGPAYGYALAEYVEG